MVPKISLWCRNIVIVVVISSIIEMILPDNKNKKYIKVVIGITILFTIIHPIIGNSFDNISLELENSFTMNVVNNSEESYKREIKKSIESNKNSYSANDIETIKNILSTDTSSVNKVEINNIK